MNFLNVMNHEGRNPESKDFHRFVEVTLKESEDESEKVVSEFLFERTAHLLCTLFHSFKL